jgi:transposase
MTDAYRWCVGIDWGGAEHAFCIVDAQGQVRGTRMVAHTVADVHDAVAWVIDVTGAAPSAIGVAIETTRGALVETLLERGFAVWAINPKQLDRFRDRFTASGAKDDRRDALVAADSLRTDRRAFRRLRIDDPEVIQLRDASRLLEELEGDVRRLANRLREQLYRVHAAWLELSPAADDPWLWTVLADAPHPDRWARLPARRVAAALRAHRIRRLAVDAVVRTLQAPRLSVAPGVADAVSTRIPALVAQLQTAHHHRAVAERHVDALLAAVSMPSGESESREHRDAEILQSLPGVGRMVAATMLAEAGDLLAARDYGTLRTYGGAAPVTKRSGKRSFTVHIRYACHTRVRQALFHWARTSIQHDPSARAYYDSLRRRGHRHARALRSVADRWLRILIAMLRTGSLYDASRLQPARTTA